MPTDDLAHARNVRAAYEEELEGQEIMRKYRTPATHRLELDIVDRAYRTALRSAVDFIDAYEAELTPCCSALLADSPAQSAAEPFNVTVPYEEYRLAP